MLKIFIRSALFVMLAHSISAMSPMQFQQLKTQFDQAVNAQQFDQAQQIINQLQAGQRGAYAPQWQLILNSARTTAQGLARQQEESKRVAEEQRRKNEEEARRRVEQARLDAEQRANIEKQLKEAIERERAAGRDYSAQLLQQIQARDAQLKAQSDELNRVRNDQAQLRLNYENINRALSSREQESKAKDEAIKGLREVYDQQSASFEAYKKACQEQASIKQNAASDAAAQANQELRTRLAETEKANAALRDQLAQSEKQRSAQAASAQDLKRTQDELATCKKDAQQIAAQVKEIQQANQDVEKILKRKTRTRTKASLAEAKLKYLKH